ncbi:hypothetical protein GCM10011490_03200 [Pseudoclavibacter endophyticus]|uniref:Biotin transporter BioY n=1 Tax=Pseudoclavibacter endophyticus TaxID=1778590 RepID=A0A6H9WGW1_9MICO|nr:biotin transporter BioY [Pseudoclavibacter endophyticus]KAB1650152.1 biotin transporter BioY [Pseudoclavibacter endophyticus]GGA56707.1 hypothetical protein GCM10011490_03200 [Pseudoclavibacter endophyticus]
MTAASAPSTPTRSPRRRRSFEASDLTRIAVFAALIAVLGLPGPIPLFGGAVPITAQTLGVMLAGAVLGPWRGAASIATVQVLVAVGLPILSGGRGGLGVFVGPTAGYFIGWLVGAIVIGLIARAGSTRPRWWRTAIAGVVGGIGVIYLFGIPVQSLVTGLGLGETALSSLVFLPGDLVKVVVTVVVVQALWRAYPRAFGEVAPSAARGAGARERSGTTPGGHDPGPRGEARV